MIKGTFNSHNNLETQIYLIALIIQPDVLRTIASNKIKYNIFKTNQIIETLANFNRIQSIIIKSKTHKMVGDKILLIEGKIN